ncbi:TPM domain-containing protein [Ottowia testudinis]|uniref:TPM domain-containing protein n=1 Tax=Ottowia testudinis TaxID=2816950 RepID=A0A975H2G8_9BURK|nr:TPM domain-containing protein [Ottowia testudinis]QTD44176.1 TPM domain-containing protein [Ottowia testudinis]
MRFQFRPTALASALVIGLLAAGAAQAQKLAAATGGKTKAQLAAELANTLQACSYDGSSIRFSPPDLSKGGSSGEQVVAEIMKYTGLPPNFVVVEAKQVPNAAAMILRDENQIQRRVIAYNAAFMGDVIKATKANNWAPVSIMAHEIGHHLSGHTVVGGGSQPPIELESDKFSGFVLYKMGANLNDAQKAIATLIPESASDTHPGRRPRLAAIADGWKQACELQGGSNCAGGTVVAAAPAPKPAAAPAAKPATPAPAPAATTVTKAENLPKPSTEAIPSKGTQFVYDEFGYLDAKIRAQFEKAMFDHAQKAGVEIVTMLVKDLGGKSAEEYAWAMLRQLRVGKLDVGNGAVLVVAPEQKKAAVAMGPGVALEMASHDKTKDLLDWIDSAWNEPCKPSKACGQWTDNLLENADHIRRNTRSMGWDIRFNSLGEAIKAYNEDIDAMAKGGVANAPNRTGRQLIRLSGTLEKIDPPKGDNAALVMETMASNGRKAALLRSAEGRTAMLYYDPRMEALMPGGKLQVGKVYSVVARVGALSGKPTFTNQLNMVSYAAAD